MEKLKSETKLMAAIFGEDFKDDDLFQERDGKQLRQVLLEVLDDFTKMIAYRYGAGKRARQIIMLRFGLEDGRSRTFEQVGKEFTLTRERIRQIEANTLRHLRHPGLSKRLLVFIKP